MENALLLLGQSGTGKSTSFRNLDPTSTFIINIEGKPMPFRGWKKHYTKLSSDGKEGNYYSSDDPQAILRAIRHVNNHRLEIKTLIIDDFGYVMMNSFMRKAMVKSYDKFSEMGKDTHDILETAKVNREDLFTIFVMHTSVDDQGTYIPKTVGKMIDNNGCIEGRFTFIFHAVTTEGRYRFLTNFDGQHMAKTSMGCFDEMYVENDLQPLLERIKAYNEGE